MCQRRRPISKYIPVLLFEYMCWLKNRGPCKIAVRTYYYSTILCKLTILYTIGYRRRMY